MFYYKSLFLKVILNQKCVIYIVLQIPSSVLFLNIPTTRFYHLSSFYKAKYAVCGLTRANAVNVTSVTIRKDATSGA